MGLYVCTRINTENGKGDTVGKVIPLLPDAVYILFVFTSIFLRV